MSVDPCETEARRNRREISWLESSGTHKMPKSVNTRVGSRRHVAHLLSRAPSRHHTRQPDSYPSGLSLRGCVRSTWNTPSASSSLTADESW